VLRAGHYGVSIGLYAPIASHLIAGGHVTLAVVGGVIAAWLTMLPDLDHHLPFVSHRGPTHSIVFALVVSAAVGLVADVVVAPVFGEFGAEGWAVLPTVLGGLGSFAAAVAVLTVVGHLLADVITPMGIRPFWPVSGWSITLRVTKARNTVANYLLLAAGTFVAATAVLAAI
jgi:inner membrane protein